MNTYVIKQSFIDAVEALSKEKQISHLDILPNSTSAILFCKKIPLLVRKLLGLEEEKYLIEGSIGIGKYVEIPWVSLFIRPITETAQKGIYIVLLVSADYSEVYLSLNQGTTYFKNKYKGKFPKVKLKETALIIRNNIDIDDRFDVEEFDLKATTERGRTYPLGHIAGKSYKLNSFPSDAEFKEDLEALLDLYNSIYYEIGKRTVDQFYDYLLAEKDGLLIEDKKQLSFTVDTAVNEQIVSSDNISDSVDKKEIKDEVKPKKEPLKNRSGKSIVPRDKHESDKAIILSDFSCEFEQTHKSFSAKKSKRNYVEAHHLIPLKYYYDEKYSNSIDVSANIVSLCPNCHKCIHLGSDNEKLILLSKLFSDERQQRLEQAGISISFDELKKYYQIKEAEN